MCSGPVVSNSEDSVSFHRQTSGDKQTRTEVEAVQPQRHGYFQKTCTFQQSDFIREFMAFKMLNHVLCNLESNRLPLNFHHIQILMNFFFHGDEFDFTEQLKVSCRFGLT